MYAFINWNNLYTNPPLCITEAQLKESFAIIDRALGDHGCGGDLEVMISTHAPGS